MSDSSILVTHDGPVLQILLNRPDKKHALTHAMYEQLQAALQAAEQDPRVRAIHVSGTGDAFTSGNDLKDFAQNPPRDLDAPVFHFLESLRTAQKPIVAAVSGVAVGIGTTMLLHCDLVYCDDTALFRLPFANLGLSPEGGSSFLLPLLAGYQKAAELLLLGETFHAATAEKIGLVNGVLPAADLQAASLQRGGDFAQAKSLFSQFLSGHGKHDTLFFSASLALAKCDEATGARADAISRIEPLMDDAANPLAPEYIFALAGIRETSGDLKGAGALYRKLIDKHADAPQVASAKAQSQIGLTRLQGPSTGLT